VKNTKTTTPTQTVLEIQVGTCPTRFGQKPVTVGFAVAAKFGGEFIVGVCTQTMEYNDLDAYALTAAERKTITRILKNDAEGVHYMGKDNITADDVLKNL